MSYLYKCPHCQSLHTMKDWHKSTGEHIGYPSEQIHPLDGEEAEACFYCCPACSLLSDGTDIDLTYLNPVNNSAALHLLNDKEG